MSSDWMDAAKRRAAQEAVRLVRDNFTVGLGSGSTAAYAIQALGRRMRREKISILAVPSSYQAMIEAVSAGVQLTTLEEHPTLDITIDGADEIDPDLNLIKGGGAALAREKIICFASKRYVVIADETKLVNRLGSKNPLPVEVLPFALPTVLKALKKRRLTVTVREGKGKAGPVVTDNGNFILDIHLQGINNPPSLDRSLREIPGIIETGLFLDVVDTAYFGMKRGGVKKQTRK